MSVRALAGEVRMRRFAIAILAMLLAACVALKEPTGPTGPTFAEDASRAGTLAPEIARIYVFWPKSDLERLPPSRLMIDGKDVGSCEYGGFIGFDVRAGIHVLTADRENFPGRCEVRLDGSGGGTYFWQLTPRASYRDAAMPGAVFTVTLVPPLMAIGVAMMYAGTSIESAGKECGGPYAVSPVDEIDALPRISGLKKSK